MILDSILTQFCIATLLLSVIGLHLIKKNLNESILYSIQSASIVTLLIASAWDKRSLTLLGIAILTLVVKVIVAPAFFARLIRRHQLKFTVSTYASTPITLIVTVFMLLLAAAPQIAPLTAIAPSHQTELSLGIGAIFISLFLIINRKDVLSQAVGILSLENSIVAFAVLAGLEQSPVLQLGIIFDIFVWIMIATIFVSMIYKHFGSLDVTTMKHLKD